ncbi:hypothetical protein [Clostridium cellulovorans]|uniref:Uncharacterized protein n=1 Tax=Clostridium cellulovorans (strain ATCC 35296 / DSM 3052 / OCM 3 / 743B) TaxID=573061 RepID=D9SRD9_CLOC7|nr:hypothetical protein [Clostridium cellulovorans]ADL52368.1 hypothetical protein Clocel_2668 [Clostridium cellulovorans 743B]
MKKKQQNNIKNKCDTNNQWTGVDKESCDFTGKKNKTDVDNQWTSTIKNSHE